MKETDILFYKPKREKPKTVRTIENINAVAKSVPATIDALKDNIREAIDELQQHTIDNVLKNWTNCVGYRMANRGSHLNKIIFHY